MDGKDPDGHRGREFVIAGACRYLAYRKKKKNDERSFGAAGGYRDPHIEFSRKGAIKKKTKIN